MSHVHLLDTDRPLNGLTGSMTHGEGWKVWLEIRCSDLSCHPPPLKIVFFYFNVFDFLKSFSQQLEPSRSSDLNRPVLGQSVISGVAVASNPSEIREMRMTWIWGYSECFFCIKDGLPLQSVSYRGHGLKKHRKTGENMFHCSIFHKDFLISRESVIDRREI